MTHSLGICHRLRMHHYQTVRRLGRWRRLIGYTIPLGSGNAFAFFVSAVLALVYPDSPTLCYRAKSASGRILRKPDCSAQHQGGKNFTGLHNVTSLVFGLHNNPELELYPGQLVPNCDQQPLIPPISMDKHGLWNGTSGIYGYCKQRNRTAL